MQKPDSYIHSAANPRVKQWAKLLERKHRDREGKFLLEGVHLIQEALAAGWPLEAIAYDEGSGVLDLFEAEMKNGREREEERGREHEGEGESESESECGPQWISVSPDVIAKCSDTEAPQPIFAVARKRMTLKERLWTNDPYSLVVVLDGVQDPGNVGTIVRSAAASGATAVVLGKGTADLYSPKTIRSTMGALFHVPVLEADLTALLPEAAAQGAAVVGTSLQAAQSCYEYDLRRSVWLVFGNEGKGLSEQVSALVSANIIIPMPGRAESLNVAMAATVMLFEAQRQRRYNRK